MGIGQHVGGQSLVDREVNAVMIVYTTFRPIRAPRYTCIICTAARISVLISLCQNAGYDAFHAADRTRALR